MKELPAAARPDDAADGDDEDMGDGEEQKEDEAEGIELRTAGGDFEPYTEEVDAGKFSRAR